MFAVFESHICILLDEEDGNPLFIDLFNDTENFPHYQRCKAQGGLVHHHHLGAAHQGTAHGKHLLLTAG